MTRQQAIAAHCKACIHDPKFGCNWRIQVQMCTAPDCALHPYRPKSSLPADEVARRYHRAMAR